MRLAFVSNILNHHQVSLCNEFQKQFDEFFFIATEQVETIGYQRAQEADFLLHYYDKDQKAECINRILMSDVVIFGGCPNGLIEMRMRKGKLSFLYSERFFKKGVWRSYIPLTRNSVNRRVGQYKNSNMYVLCASAYLPYDLTFLRFSAEKCFKWGYFPELRKYDIKSLLDKKESTKIKLLWAGRLLKWKHPEAALVIARKLLRDNVRFEMNIIGSGEMEDTLKKMLTPQLASVVYFCGAKTPDEVRKYMEEADIYMATSDYYEGWGAVLNEAMNSGCAVVASHAMGATPYLLENGRNGYIYKSGNINDLYCKVKKLCEDRDLRRKFGCAAYMSISRTWNSKEAAKRFRKLIGNILENKNNILKEGPCSKAEIIKNNWMKAN